MFRGNITLKHHMLDGQHSCFVTTAEVATDKNKVQTFASCVAPCNHL